MIEFTNWSSNLDWTDPPVHWRVLQSFCCSATPTQPLPPAWGDGLSHWRLLDLTPPPQGSEHSLQAPHWLQPPSTWQPGTDWHCRTPASHELGSSKKDDNTQNKGKWKTLFLCMIFNYSYIYSVVLYQFLQSLMMLSPGFAVCQSDPPGHTHDTFLESRPPDVVSISSTKIFWSH